jgi:SAM-dependent methyltransferase
MVSKFGANETIEDPRQKWDQRYAALSSTDLSEPTAFVALYLPQLSGPGRALDIAAGTGRNSLALTRQGFRVDAVDISWQGLHLGRQRALALGLPAAQIRFIVADVERSWLPLGSYDLILVSRFLYRPLFPLIKDRLGPGGWLMYETFLAEPKAQSQSCGSMSEHYLLKPDELRLAFADLEIIHYREIAYHSQEDYHQRASAQLVARKSVL